MDRLYRQKKRSQENEMDWKRLNKMTRVLSLLLLVVFVQLGFAQRLDGTIRGTVTDQTGAVVKGAAVTVTNNGTGVAHTTTTSDAGTYNVPNLTIGAYTVKIEAQGFAAATRKDVQVDSTKITEVSQKLGVQ